MTLSSSVNKVTARSIINAYDRYSRIYDLIFGVPQADGQHKMAQAVHRLSPEKLLEVGVGTGLTLPMYPEQTSFTGIDLSESMLSHAKIRAARLLNRDIQLALMNAEDMQFADDSFDCVTLPYVLSVTPKPDQLVEEVRRVCRPGGHIIIVNHFSGSPLFRPLEWILGPLADRIGFRSRFSLRENVSRHSWKVLSNTGAGPFGLYRVIVIENV